jgi:hypothetical protein
VWVAWRAAHGEVPTPVFLCWSDVVFFRIAQYWAACCQRPRFRLLLALEEHTADDMGVKIRPNLF